MADITANILDGLERSLPLMTQPSAKAPPVTPPGNLSPAGTEPLVPEEIAQEQDGQPGQDMGHFPSITQAASQFGLKPSLTTILCDQFGCDDPDHTEAEDFTSMTEKEVEQELASLLSEGKVTKLELGNMRKFFRRLREWFAPSESSTPTTKQVEADNEPIVLPKASDADTYEFYVHLAQKTKGTFKKLPSPAIFRLRDGYRTCCGTEPPEAERPSDLQLSALAAWTAPSTSDPLGKHPIRRLFRLGTI